MINHLLGVLLTMIVAVPAMANLDITCMQGDCLQFGWQIFDPQRSELVDVICRDEDCEMNGWFGIFKNRTTEEVVCKPEGCFNEGWTVYDNRGRMTADATCLQSFASNDCLVNGWTTFQPGYGNITYRCTQGDCRNIGWDVSYPFRPIVRCKSGGCFNSGWTAYR